MFSRARMRALPLLTRVNEQNLENVDGEEITSKKLVSKVSLQKFVKLFHSYSDSPTIV